MWGYMTFYVSLSEKVGGTCHPPNCAHGVKYISAGWRTLIVLIENSAVYRKM